MRCQKNMAKKLIDANAILRYLLNDVESMAAESAQVIKNGAFTIPEVLAEVVYVLMKVYHVERQEISKVLIIFLNSIEINRKDIMIKALEIFADTNLDFVDCILISYNKTDSVEIFSFDKKLQGEN